MQAKEILSQITECLKNQHSSRGVTEARRIDGYKFSSVNFALKKDEKTKAYKLILIEEL